MAEEEIPTEELEDRSRDVSNKILSYLGAALFTLALTVACLVLGFNHLKVIYAELKQLQAEQPLSRYDVFTKKIVETKTEVENQYYQHTRLMDDADIQDVNSKFNGIYNAAYQHEIEYSRFIKLYKAGAFNLARRIRGSGQWYEIFNIDLGLMLENSINRQSALKKYTKETRKSDSRVSGGNEKEI